MLALILAATAGCDNQFTRLGMPEPITEQGKRVVSLWQGSWIAAFGVGALVWGLIIWAVIFHRKRSNDLPPQVRYNMPIEALYTVVPFIIVAVLFYFTARDETYLDEVSGKPDVTVNVTAFQWSWKFDYPQSGVSVVGRPGQDPTLVIPKGEKILFNLHSTDVIHSFWVPAFLFKRDVIPGRENRFEVTTTKTGHYAGRCAELCGVDHSRMLFNVDVVTPAQYQNFIAKNKPAGSAQ